MIQFLLSHFISIVLTFTHLVENLWNEKHLHKLVEGFLIGPIKSGSMGYMVLEGCNMVTSKQTNKKLS
jgi:hypothetical protein